jgi:hypothetical protein
MPNKGAKGTYHKQPAAVGEGVQLTPAGSSVNTQLSSDYNFIHIHTDADIHIAFGASAPTAVADHTCLWIKANTPYIFPYDPGHYIAAIGTATVNIHYMV